MTQEKIADRIRKLMELSKSTNEHEAAQAAARASELMREHDITEAMLEVANRENEPVPHVPERIVTEGMNEEERTKQRVAWRDRILSALATSLDLERYFSGGNLIAFGRESHVQTWKYLGMYLVAEVDRLADQAWLDNGADLAAVGQTPRQWKSAYRLGAADVIAERLHAEHRDRHAKELAFASTRAKELGGNDQAAFGNEYLALVRVNSALEILAKDRAEVEERFKSYGKTIGLRSMSSIGNSTRNRSGYGAGREAGASVALRGGRKALKS